MWGLAVGAACTPGLKKVGCFGRLRAVLIRTWVKGLRSALLLVSIGGAAACSNDQRPPKSDLSRNDLQPERPSPSDAGTSGCTRPGCTCEDEGETRDCGTVKEEIAGYLWCSLGVQSCEDGVWSECKSERLVLSKQLQNLRLQGLGDSRSCADDNPCSPGCHLFEDDSDGLPLEPGSGLVEEGDGLRLAETSDVPGGVCTSIEVTPATSELRVTDLEPLSPNAATFSARLLPEDCAGHETPVAWSVNRPDVATISETGTLTLVAPVAGPIDVTALAGHLSGSATLNVELAIEDTSEAPPDAATNFGADGAAADTFLTWLYPYAGTVFPPNVNAPLLQWDSLVTAEASWNGGCALRADGRVRCWGTNVYGEITDLPGPYVQLSGRYAHFCALTAAGNADCWGDNSYAQANDEPGPFIQVSAGAQHSCGLRPDGTAECWGRNQYGQSTPPNGAFVKLSGGAYTSCGLRENGDVVCWGNSASGQGGVTPGPFIDVAAGTEHVCAIRRDLSLHCWGSSSAGQTSAPAGTYVSLDAGTYHTCALRTDGQAVCWGRNNQGQSATVEGPFVHVTAAREHSCGVSVTGAVVCFGDTTDNHAVGLPGGSVRVGLRYPSTGDAIFEWSSVIAESRLHHADPPLNQVALAPAPRFRIPQAVWAALSASAGDDEFAFTIQRHTGDRLLDVVERVARFSDSPLTGQILYQSYGTRSVLNAVGTYEDEGERWGAAVFAYDAAQRSNSVVAGFTNDTGASGVEAGCRGCHAVGATNHLMLTGFDNQRDAAFRALDDVESVDVLLPAHSDEYGGALWSAVHPTLPLAFSSRGPTPCAVRVGEFVGSCPADEFSSIAGDLIGTGHVLQNTPGGLVGSAWLDADADGVFDGSSPNRIFNLSEANLGAVVASDVPETLRAAMPVFSPEGDRIAFVHYAGDMEDGLGTIHAGDRRSLGMMDFDEESVHLYNFQRLTTESDEPCDPRFDATQACVDVWPSFLPGGSGLVFERQVFGNGGIAGTAHSDFGGTRSGCENKDQPTCDDGAKGELWWVALDSDGQPTARHRLDQANGVVNSDHLVTRGPFTTPGVSHSDEVEPLLSYQPAVAPKTHGSHDWVAFTSRRAYGNVATSNPWWSDPGVHPIGADVPTKKVWLSAVSADAQADDPSAPAFYLEGQETRGANGHPVWIENACVQPSAQLSSANECSTDADCCGAPDTARCEVSLPVSSPSVRHCVPVVPGACIEPGSTLLCETDDDCCGAASGERCSSGQCVMPPQLPRFERATFVRDYQADCPDGTVPEWQFVEWQAALPEGTLIQFDVATATSEDSLDEQEAIYQATATPPGASTWTTWGTKAEDSIDANLAAEGYPSSGWLRIWITLIPDEARVQTPVLERWRLVYDCKDAF